MAAGIRILPLPLLKSEGALVVQCIQADFIISSVNHDNNIILSVKRGSYKKKFNLGKAEALNFRRELFLPEVESEEKAEFIFEYGSEITAASVIFRPVRRWTVHLVLHSHTDLGFTAPVSEVAQIHNSNTDEAVAFCKETAKWPEGSRFKWTCEVTWQVQNYLRSRSIEKIAELITHIKNNDIAVAGMYSGELTELLGHEQAARSFYYAAKLRREYDITIDTAMLCDVPGCTKGFVQLMYKSGIKNLIIADNNFIAPFLQRTDLPRPFYWCGDDNSNVLSWYTDHPFYAYWEGENYGFSKGCSDVKDKLVNKLIELEECGYPYEDYQLQYAFDNFKIQFTPAEIVKEWNEKWLYPKIRMATAGEFLNKMRNLNSKRIPSLTGDWTCWWDGIVNAFPYEEALSRSLHCKIPAVETAASLLSVIDNEYSYPAVEIEKLYDDTLAFDEHSGTGMVWEPGSPEIQDKALREGYGFIYKPLQKVKELQDIITDNLSKMIKCNSMSVAVINYSSFPRDINIQAEYQHPDASVILADCENNAEVKGRINNNKIFFNAGTVPGIGYKVFQIKEVNGVAELLLNNKNIQQNTEDIIIENNYWKISVCKNTGAVHSVYNKILSCNINNGYTNTPLIYITMPLVGIEMGKYVPEVYNGTEVPGKVIAPKGKQQVEVQSEICQQSDKIIISHYAGGVKWLEQQVSVENEILLFTNILSGRCLNDKEYMNKYISSEGMLYFHFPFNIDNSMIKYESTCSVIEPAHEQFKGTCMDYTPVQGWCHLFNNDIYINFCSPDAPLIDIGEIALQKYREKFTENPSDLFIRGVSLRDITGAIKSPYNKEPDITFRFAVNAGKLSAGTDSLQSACELSEKMQDNVFAVLIPGGQEGCLPGKDYRFITGIPSGVRLITVKKAEDNNGIIIRFRELYGQKGNMEIRCNMGEIYKAYLSTITEENISEILLKNNKIPVSFEAYSIETIRVIFKNEK
jgi:hypothetical protein